MATQWMAGGNPTQMLLHSMWPGLCVAALPLSAAVDAEERAACSRMMSLSLKTNNGCSGLLPSNVGAHRLLLYGRVQALHMCDVRITAGRMAQLAAGRGQGGILKAPRLVVAGIVLALSVKLCSQVLKQLSGKTGIC
jgi:hypothetical protein